MLYACDKKIPYRSCDSLLSATCSGNDEGEFCTYGFKWGDNKTFAPAGTEKEGPKTAGGEVSYSFQASGMVFNTHSQTNVVSKSFESIKVCDAKVQIRHALQAWEAVANIKFVESSNPLNSDIRFLVADIKQGGLVAYPPFDLPFVADLCSTIAGQVVFNVQTRNTCDGFYNLALHEVGHVLGLGHVNSRNIMNPNFSQNVVTLQPGDIKGIQAIYGEK